MNREIEFRGIHNNKWIYGYLVKSLDDNKFYITVSTDQFYQINESTIGQYTGLKDKNGKKIFEGDIIKYKSSYIKRAKRGIIIYDDKELASYIITKSLKEKHIYSADIFDLLDETWTCEVIGTIFDKENKE